MCYQVLAGVCRTVRTLSQIPNGVTYTHNVIRSLLVYVCRTVWKLSQFPNGATYTSKDLITHAATPSD